MTQTPTSTSSTRPSLAAQLATLAPLVAEPRGEPR